MKRKQSVSICITGLESFVGVWVSQNNHYTIIVPQGIRGRHHKLCLFTWTAYYIISNRREIRNPLFLNTK